MIWIFQSKMFYLTKNFLPNIISSQSIQLTGVVFWCKLCTQSTLTSSPWRKRESSILISKLRLLFQLELVEILQVCFTWLDPEWTFWLVDKKWKDWFLSCLFSKTSDVSICLNIFKSWLLIFWYKIVIFSFMELQVKLI